MQDWSVILLMITVLQSQHKSGGYYELIEELGCHDTEFRLSCGPLDAHIAILEATFSQNDSFLEPLHTSCGKPGQPPDENNWRMYDVQDWSNSHKTNGGYEINFQHAINRRCSGVNYCSFELYGDYAPALNWGPGSVYLRYACMDGVHVTKSCNSNLDVEIEGFVQTPGYPRFYVGGRTCHWTLKAPPRQTVKVTFLDISLRGIGPFEQNCLDWLIVTEDGLDLLSTCGDATGNTVVKSIGPVLNITLTTASKRLFPKRGLLFHYKAVGCLPPKKPEDGYLVHHNETFAHFRCCVGFVFPDTMTRDRIVKCHNENTWDLPVPDCINASVDAGDYLKVNSTIEPSAVMEKTEMIKDILIPTVIMCSLLIVNGIILLLIYHYRRKLASSSDSELEEITEMEIKRLNRTRE